MNDGMYFFIDTSVRRQIRLAMIPISDHHRITERIFKDERNAVASAERFFNPHLGRARGIIVVEGPGSFSAIRSGVLLGNLLGRLLGVPLYKVSAHGLGLRAEGRENAFFEEIRERIAKKKLKSVSYVAPVYDQEPNIT